MALLEATHITKRYGDTPVLRGVSVAAASGEIVALLGPSGCGKTTLLRIIAGLETADEGALMFDGQPLNDVPVYRRGFGLMFQDYALFPHRNVADNVAFGLRMHGQPVDGVARRVEEMLALVGLGGYGARRVYELSGGERQRVALARSLAPRPRLLMLDEPLAALDRTLRERLQDELGRILREVGVTSIYVTHDQGEAFALADRIVLMNAGRIEQHGPPEQVYRHPATPWAARFLGMTNLVSGEIIARADDAVEVVSPLGRLRVVPSDHAATRAVTLLLRPDSAHIAHTPRGAGVIHGTLTGCTFRGATYRVAITHTSGIELTFDLDQRPGRIGDDVTLSLDPAGLAIL